MDMSQYMGTFLEESREHLQSLNDNLLILENDPGSTGVVDAIFRSAHTLKGMSATMGFNVVAELTHQMENVLQKIRSGEMSITPATIDVLFKCLDTLEAMMTDISNGGQGEEDIAELLAQLRGEPTFNPDIAEVTPTYVAEENSELIDEEAFYLNEFEKNILNQALEASFNIFHIIILIKSHCIMKSARAYMVFRVLEDMGEIVKSIPKVQDIEDEKFDNSFSLLFITKQENEAVLKSLNSIAELEEPKITCFKSKLASLSAAPVAATCEAVQDPKHENIPSNEFVNKSVSPSSPKKIKTGQTVRVDIERLDKLMNMVGELVINKTRLEQISKANYVPELNETLEHMNRLTTDLQNVVMTVRMVPIEQVFSRFPRMIRDLTRDLGKDINFVIEGKETELDRTVIDEIGDPLVHLLRNSIDHGIEMPDEREAVGKPRTGLVKLIACHEGNNVIIEVMDNGKGLNPAILKEKAVEKGIISSIEAAQMDEQAAIKLIFNAGFSTASAVTDISGRGVGLDAVKNKIEALNGEVDIESKIGGGTKFRIQLPLTLAIIQALLVKVGPEYYAIPLASIAETTSIFPDQIKLVQDQEVIMLRGTVLPLVRLNEVLEVPAVGATTTAEEELFVVVVNKADKRVGLVVDNLIGQQDIVIKPLGNLLSGLPSLAGATILGNGQVSLILDVPSLF